MKGVYGGSVEALSARSVFPELWRCSAAGLALRHYLKSKTRSPIFVLRRGAESLVDSLVRRLAPESLHIGRVQEVQSGGGGRFELTLEGGARLQAKEVFIATSGAASADMLGGVAPRLAEALRAVRYAALVVAHCAAPCPAPIHRDGFGVLFSGASSSRLLGIMYNSELFPHLAPQGQHLLTLCFGGVGAGDLCRRDDAFFAAAACGELRERLGVESRLLNVVRWPCAIPQYEVGHYRITAMMRDLEHSLPGIHFIGADTGGIAVPDRVLRSLAEVRASAAGRPAADLSCAGARCLAGGALR